MLNKSLFIISLLTLCKGQFSGTPLDNLGNPVSAPAVSPMNAFGSPIQSPVSSLSSLGSPIQSPVSPLSNLGSPIQSPASSLPNLAPQIPSMQSPVSPMTAPTGIPQSPWSNTKITYPLSRMGDQEPSASHWEEDFAPLGTLGERIEKHVMEGLEPLQQMQSEFRVIHGSEGTTVATFYPSGKAFVIRDGVVYGCNGTILEDNGTCSGELEKLKFDNKEDFCYTPSKTVFDEWYCIPSSQGVSITYINGKWSCKSNDDGPVLEIRQLDFWNLCKGATTVSYKYFTNESLGHMGAGLDCVGNGPQICTLSDVSRVDDGVPHGGHGGVKVYSSG